MKRFVPAFGVPLILAVGLAQGDTRLTAALPAASGYVHLSSSDPLPGTLWQALAPKAKAPKVLSSDDQQQAIQRYLNGLQLRTTPQAPQGRRPGDTIPRTYLVFGLRTGPGGMAFTDRNGVALPVPSNARVILKPFITSPTLPPPILPPTLTLPPIYTIPRTLTPPPPKK